MRRIFGLFAVTAAGLGLLLLFAGPDGPSMDVQVRALQDAPFAYSGWALGLIMGLGLAWLASIEWADLPVRLGAWMRVQGRRLALAALGGAFAGILLFF